jgi:hypothetical protein
MKKNKCFGFMAMVLLGLFTASGLAAQTTIQQTYYVNATTGNDDNNGRREETPFKTLEKAIESAKMGVVRTITIIGSVNGDGFRIERTGSDEITITGKPNANETEKARIINGLVIGDLYDTSTGVNIRFSHITIEGSPLDGYVNTSGTGIILFKAKVTLGLDAVIQNCANSGILGNTEGRITSSVILTDNAIIRDCVSYGIYGVNSVIMTGNSSIINTSRGRGMSWGDLTMSGNSKISGNKGGGISAGTVTISENAEVSNNNIPRSPGNMGIGGGIRANNLVMRGGRIINNVARDYGGGVYSSKVEITGGEISGNQAERGGGVYIDDNCTMSGGVISGNKAEYGAGVYYGSDARSFNQSGGRITGNEAEFVGGGIYISFNRQTYTNTGGTVDGNTAGDGVGNDVFNR